MPPGFAEGALPRVEVRGLSHAYGSRTALRDVSFAVRDGEIFGLLGPNGGGKSTLFRILTTLLIPAGGTVRVAGHDVVAAPDAVRRRLGVVFQHPSVDGQLTVEENLAAHGALYGLGGRVLRDRVAEHLRHFGLTGRRGDRVGTLSGGLARRVELAKALLSRPALLVMDEPSAGLDPNARRDLMTLLQGLRATTGLTVLLTTHHMEEAERCDRIAVLDEGHLVAIDTPSGLKAQVGGDVVTIRARNPDALEEVLRSSFGVHPERVDGALCFEAERAHDVVHRVVERFAGEIDAVSFGKPTLEDAFFRLTGRRLQDAAEVAA